MKNKIFIIIATILIVFGCKNRKSFSYEINNKQIVDYNLPNQTYVNLRNLNSNLEKLKSQTIVLVDDKLTNPDTFKQLLEQKKIYSVKIIDDSSSIKKLNFSYKTVKKIIYASKK